MKCRWPAIGPQKSGHDTCVHELSDSPARQDGQPAFVPADLVRTLMAAFALLSSAARGCLAPLAGCSIKTRWKPVTVRGMLLYDKAGTSIWMPVTMSSRSVTAMKVLSTSCIARCGRCARTPATFRKRILKYAEELLSTFGGRIGDTSARHVHLYTSRGRGAFTANRSSPATQPHITFRRQAEPEGRWLTRMS